MKKNHNICESDSLSRYMDNELGPEDHSHVENHIKSCFRCRKILEHYLSVAEEVKMGTDIPEGRYSELPDRVMAVIALKKAPFFTRLKEAMSLKMTLIPAGAIVFLVIISFAVFHNSGPKGPTAIITSLSGQSSSILILETPGTRQTILWFDEKG